MKIDMEIVSSPNGSLCYSANFILLRFLCKFKSKEMAAILKFKCQKL